MCAAWIRKQRPTFGFFFFGRLEQLNEVFNKKQKALLSFAMSGCDRVVALLAKTSTLISKVNELNGAPNHSGVNYINIFQAIRFTGLCIFYLLSVATVFEKKIYVKRSNWMKTLPNKLTDF